MKMDDKVLKNGTGNCAILAPKRAHINDGISMSMRHRWRIGLRCVGYVRSSLPRPVGSDLEGAAAAGVVASVRRLKTCPW